MTLRMLILERRYEIFVTNNSANAKEKIACVPPSHLIVLTCLPLKSSSYSSANDQDDGDVNIISEVENMLIRRATSTFVDD